MKHYLDGWQFNDDAFDQGDDIGRRTNDSNYFPGNINYLRIC